MGTEFARLHKIQSERINNRKKDKNAEFARKTLSLAVVSSWGYASGLFQKNEEHLNKLYSLPDSVSEPDDLLNAKALSKSRLKGVDPDTYRGLGTRTSPKELGRMLEVFIVLVTKASKFGITEKLANAAIQSFEAKKSIKLADQTLDKI